MNIDNDINWLMNKVNALNSSSIDLKNSQKTPSSRFLAPSFGLTTFPQRELPKKTLLDEKSSLNFSKNILFNKPVYLEVGSIIAVKLGLIFEHTGIYIGDGQVIELYGDGSINQITLKQFMFGAYKDNPSLLDIVARTGLNIYTACHKGNILSDHTAAERATLLKARYQKIDYHILNNNCHMFSGFCLFGQKFQENCGCRFFTNLTQSIVEYFNIRLNDFEWQFIANRY